MRRQFVHCVPSVLAEFPCRWGFIVITCDSVTEIRFNHGTGDWEIALLAILK